MNIKQLRIFVKVYNAGSFTKAADSLYMTQQAVSHSISTLEKSLNCVLFQRNSSPLKLTMDGEFLYKNCQSLLHEDELLEYKLAHRYDENKILHVGYGFGMLRNLPKDMFSSFQKKYPSYHVVGTEMLNLTCEERVKSGDLDVGFTIGPVDGNDFSSLLLFRDRFVAIVESWNPLAQKRLVNINDLRGQHIICNSGKNRDSLIAYCEKAGFYPDIIHCCTDLISQMYLCQNSANIVVTVDQLLDSMFRQHTSLRKIYFDDSFYSWEMHLITKKDRRPSRLVNTFISFIAENCSNE